MKKFKRHKTITEVLAQCEAQGVPTNTKHHDEEGGDTIVVGQLYPLDPLKCHVIYNLVSGRFRGRTDEGVWFTSDHSGYDRRPWMQALLHFFLSND